MERHLGKPGAPAVFNKVNTHEVDTKRELLCEPSHLVERGWLGWQILERKLIGPSERCKAPIHVNEIHACGRMTIHTL